MHSTPSYFNAIMASRVMDRVALYHPSDEPLDVEEVFDSVGIELDRLSIMMLNKMAKAHGIVKNDAVYLMIMSDAFKDSIKADLKDHYCRHMQIKLRAMMPDINGRYFYNEGYIAFNERSNGDGYYD